MATRYQAHIKDAQAYAAFKKLAPDLPPDFDEWQKQTASRGGAVVDVDADEFVRYCQASGVECNSYTLGGFVVAKASGRSY